MVYVYTLEHIATNPIGEKTNEARFYRRIFMLPIVASIEKERQEKTHENPALGTNRSRVYGVIGMDLLYPIRSVNAKSRHT